MELIDTHAHLFAEQFDEDLPEMMARTFEAGVKKCYLPNIDLTSIDKMIALEEKYPGQCFSMIGLHPCSVKADYKEVLKAMAARLNERKWFGIGETGLDFYWDKTFKNEQIEALHQHCQWAKEYQLPIILHTRDSFEETYQVIKEENDDNLRGIFHCFGGNQESAEKVIDLGGFYMGIGGVLTFKNSNLKETLTRIDLKHLVLETDSPYLAPTPHRGKRNESSFLPLVAEKIAEVKNISLESVAKITTENALKIYGV